MATVTKDLRRQDDNRTLWHPYWISSREVSYAHMTDANPALLWSFPTPKYGSRIILIENVVIQIVTAFTGGTPSMDVGSWTIATDDAGDAGDTITVVDQDEFIPTADITEATPGTYFAATGDWITAWLLKTKVAPVIITPAAATVPCVCLTGYATASAGAARVHMQIQEVPLI